MFVINVNSKNCVININFITMPLMPEGEQYSHKSLPVILKNYQTQSLQYLVFYAED